MVIDAYPKVDRVASLVIFAMAILWVTVGYLVAPVLFAELPSKLAGEVAGKLFEFSSLIVLVVLIMLLGVYIGLEQSIRSIKSLVVAAVLVSLLRFWIAPWMAEIKAAYPLGVTRASPDWGTFSSLHGVYQLVFLMVIALLLFWSIQRTLHERMHG
ncbi:MAG: DUF4149 domain-containing protein [Thiomicrorhabdus sp.]|nr:DUF4149 domain-containing protein [Thiomicrorhabdus sp.]MCF6345979.1 DUF4149 domain-containing protein [Thiomicrorhabdus sp.]